MVRETTVIMFSPYEIFLGQHYLHLSDHLITTYLRQYTSPNHNRQHTTSEHFHPVSTNWSKEAKKHCAQHLKEVILIVSNPTIEYYLRITDQVPSLYPGVGLPRLFSSLNIVLHAYNRPGSYFSKHSLRFSVH